MQLANIPPVHHTISHTMPSTTVHIRYTLTTTGNDLRLQKNRTRYDLRNLFFTNTVINMWNSPPNSVVHAESTAIFQK